MDVVEGAKTASIGATQLYEPNTGRCLGTNEEWPIAQIRHSPPNLISRVYGVFNSVGEPLSVESLFNMNSTSARCFLMYS
jgi:hypothetical protein